ncbi:MAG: hypothetical protein ABI588_03515 [Arenimonas sp.]
MMRFDVIPRLANRGTMVLAALVVGLAIAFVFERSALGALQYVTAFVFYLAVMVAAIPLPALRTPGGHYTLSNWLALLLAICYAGNAVYVGRWQQVLLLAIAGLVVGLVVGAVDARRLREPLQHAG